MASELAIANGFVVGGWLARASPVTSLLVRDGHSQRLVHDIIPKSGVMFWAGGNSQHGFGVPMILKTTGEVGY